MLRILSWNSNTGFEKMPSQDTSSYTQTYTAPVVSCANIPGKRKRSFAVEKPTVLTIVKEEPRSTVPISQEPSVHVSSFDQPLPQAVEFHASPSEPTPCEDVEMKADMEQSQQKLRSREEAQLATMRQTISSQFNLEILMKHRELRLIDQELAKCQVALEQLRRCSEIPYPALQSPSEQVSTGSGASLRKAQKQQARSPAPWGVTDGPYSRHYAKWLLHDPYFDGGEVEHVASLSAGNTPLHGRSTRGVFTDFAQMVGKTSRSQRALHQGLPPGFVEPKSKPTGPMILKRKSDGKMVKLVCPDCARFDFGSAQGFINHCRIGHQRNFASHDAAAEGCGEPIEVDENGQMKGAVSEAVQAVRPITVAPTVSTPIATTPITPIAPVLTPISFPTTTTTTHPLIRSAHLLTKDSLALPLVPGGFVPKAEVHKSPLPKTENQCSQTPNLSAFIQNRGLALDLNEAVVEAKRRDDLVDEFDYADMEIDTPLPTPNGNSRMPAVGGKKPSTKAVESSAGARKPSFTSMNTSNGVHDFHGFTALVPSPTNESTQAPSLIDDDEEMDPQSPPSSDEHDDSDVPFHVRDDEQLEDSDLRNAEEPAQPTSCTQSTNSDQQAMAAPPDFTKPSGVKGVRQFNFIAENPRSGDHGDKKRRRIGD